MSIHAEMQLSSFHRLRGEGHLDLKQNFEQPWKWAPSTIRNRWWRRSCREWPRQAYWEGSRVVTIKLLSYNIRYGGVGRDQYLAAMIDECKPDLVVFQEATRPQVIKPFWATSRVLWTQQPGLMRLFLTQAAIRTQRMEMLRWKETPRAAITRPLVMARSLIIQLASGARPSVIKHSLATLPAITTQP